MSWKHLIKAINDSYTALPAKDRKEKINKVIKTDQEKAFLLKYFPKLYKETLKNK